MKAAVQNVAAAGRSMKVLRTVTYSKISGDRVIAYAEENTGIAAGTLAGVMRSIARTISNFVLNGHAVEIPDLGILRFSLSATAPKADDEEGITGADAVYRRRILFKPSGEFKDELETLSFTQVEEDNEEQS